MNEKKETKVNYNFSLANMLTVAFVVLKLCKVIAWSWVWVLSPLWISLIVGIVVAVIIGIINYATR